VRKPPHRGTRGCVRLCYERQTCGNRIGMDGSIPALGTLYFKGSDLIGAFFISAFLSSSGLGEVWFS
jgi:hypothetical protein